MNPRRTPDGARPRSCSGKTRVFRVHAGKRARAGITSLGVDVLVIGRCRHRALRTSPDRCALTLASFCPRRIMLIRTTASNFPARRLQAGRPDRGKNRKPRFQRRDRFDSATANNIGRATRSMTRSALRGIREDELSQGIFARGNARRSGCRKWRRLQIVAVRFARVGRGGCRRAQRADGININDGCGSMHPMRSSASSKSRR